MYKVSTLLPGYPPSTQQDSQSHVDATKVIKFGCFWKYSIIGPVRGKSQHHEECIRIMILPWGYNLHYVPRELFAFKSNLQSRR
uniref:Uncharacterized protein n=1 Tax=Triticum urartu TaxID=4572 RepID=A0A8R7UB55_TRIUA